MRCLCESIIHWSHELVKMITVARREGGGKRAGEYHDGERVTMCRADLTNDEPVHDRERRTRTGGMRASEMHRHRTLPEHIIRL